MARNLQLDILRGIAILLVIGAHMRLNLPEGPVGVFGQIWRDFGGFGVSLFFTLSGYLIGGLLLSELQRHGSISVRRFLIRRGLKIYPPYFVFLIYLIAMPTTKAYLSGQDALNTITELLHDYLPNALFLQNYIGPNPAGHTWSLAVEEHFYLSLPFLLIFFVATRRIWLLLPVCLLAPIGFTLLRLGCAYFGDPYIHSLNRTVAATHLCIDALLVGVGIRAIVEFKPERFAALRPWRYVAVILGIGLLAMNALCPLPTIFGVYAWRILPITTCAAAAILLGALHIRASDFGCFSFLVSPTARLVGWVGLYSYSIYLWHMTAIGFAERAIVGRLPAIHSQLGWSLAALVTSVIVIILGVAASRLVELPVLFLRDRYFPSRT